MGKVTSIRGRTVDFDLLKMREDMLSSAPSGVVVERQQSIEDQIRTRREQRKQARERMLKKQQEENDTLTVADESKVVDSTDKPVRVRKNVSIPNEE